MLTHEHKGRMWTQIGREPRTRKDGTAAELIRWRTPCGADGCSGFAEIKTSLKFDLSHAFDAKHCPAHKLTREEVTARWLAAVKARRSVEDLL